MRFVRPAPVNPISLQVAQVIQRSGLSYREVARRLGVKDADLARLADPFFTGQTVTDLQRVAGALHLTVNVTFDETLVLPAGTVLSTVWQSDTSLVLELRDHPDVAAATLPLSVQSAEGTFSLLERYDVGDRRVPGRTVYRARLISDRL